MIVKIPSFYNDFQCIASKCTDNCCIGWEIDIDDETMDIYENVGGEFGKRLQDDIETDDYPHFKLTSSERCPFLNSNNLCDIILNIGEENICEICREHPRFHSWYGRYKESGLGLCCEEAVRLLLDCNKLDFLNIETDESDDDYPFDRDIFENTYKLRECIFELFNSDKPIFEKLSEVLKICSYKESFPDLDYILNSVKDTEPIDNSWVETITAILDNKELIKSEFHNITSNENTRYSKVASYLIYRYLLKDAVYGNDISGCAFFVSVFIILLRCADILYPERIIDNIKLISKQTEYSDENMQMIYKGF